MNKLLILAVLALLINVKTNAQKTASNDEPKLAQFVDLGVGLSKDNKIATMAYYKSWQLSNSKKVFRKIYIGTGARFTGFSGNNNDFRSAPPSLYGIPEKEDTLNAPTPKIFALNTFINFGYNFSSKFQIGFDLDVFGFSFGPTGNPTFISNGSKNSIKASPTLVNVLLVGANDRGTLNGGLYARYRVSEKIALRATYHTVFTELTTKETSQTTPEKNNRFRHGFNPVAIGVSYLF